MKWVWASARYLAFGRTPGYRRLAKCDAGSSQTGGFFPAAAGILCAAPGLVRTLAQHGFFRLCRAHPTAGAQSRTQQRHAPHGAVQTVCPPTGSIGTIISTVGRSAPSTLFRQISRSPLLFRNETKMPFCLRASTLFRIWCEKLFGVQPSLPAGSIFSKSAFAGALISDSFRRSSERRFSI